MSPIQRTQGDEHLEFWWSVLEVRSFVYFIQGDPDTPIKIGYSTNPVVRMAGFQTNHWQRLRLLHCIPGDQVLEQQLHRHLREDHVRGEWFQGPTMDSFMAKLPKMAQQMVNLYEGDGVAPTLRPDLDAVEHPVYQRERWQKIADTWYSGRTEAPDR